MSEQERLTRDDLDLINGLGHDAWSSAYPMPEKDQRRLGELALHAWAEIQRLRQIERLAWVAHWGVDALWSTTTAPDAWPVRLDPLWAYMHDVLDHGEEPDAGRIEELMALVDAAYDHQRPGLSIGDLVEKEDEA